MVKSSRSRLKMGHGTIASNHSTVVWHCGHSTRLYFVWNTTECNIRRYGHLVIHVKKKKTLTESTITFTLAYYTPTFPVPNFLLSPGSTFLIVQWVPSTRCLTISTNSTYFKPDLSSFPRKWVLSLGSLFMLKALLLFIQSSREDPVLPDFSLKCPFISGSCLSTHTARALPTTVSAAPTWFPPGTSH